MVVDAQQQGLEDHRFGEPTLDDDHRRPGEVDLALGVAPDVAGEAVVGQPAQEVVVEPDLLAEEGQRLLVEPELPQRPERPPDPGDDADKVAMQVIQQDASRAALVKQLQTLRQAAKIEYQEGFAAPKTTAPAAAPTK